MKKINRFLMFSFALLLVFSFMQGECYADNSMNHKVRTEYIDESFCYLDIYSDGEASIDVFCRAKSNKTIYGEIIIQRKGWFGWSHTKTINVTGYNGSLDKNKTYNLSKKGVYRVKFKTTCGGETYSVYSTEEEY